jgi:hypothetical protein
MMQHQLYTLDDRLPQAAVLTIESHEGAKTVAKSDVLEILCAMLSGFAHAVTDAVSEDGATADAAASGDFRRTMIHALTETMLPKELMGAICRHLREVNSGIKDQSVACCPYCC